jgi:hypothetical protein
MGSAWGFSNTFIEFCRISANTHLETTEKEDIERGGGPSPPKISVVIMCRWQYTNRKEIQISLVYK